jgi:hypothetical protein
MGAELGRISGPLLSANLLRNGIDLAFETDLLYLNVVDGRIGINTDAPTKTLTVSNALSTTNILVDTRARIASLLFEDNLISNSTGSIVIQPDQSSDPKIVTTKISTSSLEISNQLIKNIVVDSNIELTPAGSGQVIFNTSNVDIRGNLHATGDITWEGNVIIGDNSLNNVTFNSDIASNIVPDATNTYNLGSLSKIWKTAFVNSLNADDITSNELVVGGIDLLLTQGNTIYVSVNGSDTNTGEHLHSTFRTVKHALSLAQPGDEVVIFPGTYIEEFPLTVPQGVSVKGTSIRAVTISPTEETKTNDAFLLNGETTVSFLTVKDFYSPGYAFKFAPNITVTTRSPYVQQTTVITAEVEGTVTPTDITAGPAPTLFSNTSDSVNLDKTYYSQALVDSLVGQTAVIDRYPAAPLFYTVVSIETEPFNSALWRMTVDSTFDTTGWLKPISFYPDVETTLIVAPDIWATTGNSVGEKWVAFYKTSLPPDFNTTVSPGWTINVAGTLYIVDYIIEDPINTNQWRIYVTTTLVGGTGIPIFSSPTGSPPLLAGNGALVDGSVATANSREASMLFFSVTFIIPNADGITVTNGARVEWLNSFSYFANRGIYLTEGTLGFASEGLRFGAEMRSINSANVYGNYGAIADGEHTLAYLIGHNFGYIGSGTNSFNDRGLVIQANEVVELNDGRIYFDSMDHKGDYRVGDIFYVNQETGKVTFNADSIDFGSLGNITLESPSSTTVINKDKIETGNLRIYGNNIDSLTGSVDLLAFSSFTYLNTDVYITGILNTSGNAVISGQVYLGDSPFDTVSINPNLTQNINPDVTNTFTLGTDDGLDPKRWNTSFLTGFNIDDVIDIRNNTISTLQANTDLEFIASGTGNIIVSSTDVQIENNLTVDGETTVNGLSSLQNTEITNIDLLGDFNQTGNTYITGTLASNNIEILGPSYFEVTNLQILDNSISATNTNDDIVLLANGSGKVNIENTLSILNSTIENFSSTATTDNEKSIKFTPNGAGNTVVDSTKSVKISVGNNVTKTLDAVGEIRFNNVYNRYEGYTPNGLVSFNNIHSYNSTNSYYYTSSESTAANTTASMIEGLSIITVDNASNIQVGFKIISGLGVAIGATVTNVQGLVITVSLPNTATLNNRPVVFAGNRLYFNNIGGLNIGQTVSGNNIQPGSVIESFTVDGITISLPLLNTIPAGTKVTFGNTANLSYITPELTPGTNDNTFRFAVNGNVKATLNSTALKTDLLYVDNVRLSSNTIRNLNVNNELVLAPNGLGYVDINNIQFRSNTITNTSENALTLSSTGLGYVKFAGTGAVYIPYGPTTDRRTYPEEGETRYNTTLNYLEVHYIPDDLILVTESGDFLVTEDNNLLDVTPVVGTWLPARGPNPTISADEVADIIDLWTMILG